MRTFQRKVKQVAGRRLLILGLVAAMTLGLTGYMMVRKTSLARPLPIHASDKIAYLTFDDGPWENTDALLDELDELGVKATFFVTAQFLDHDALVAKLKKIHDRGHQVNVHSYTHKFQDIYQSVDAYLDDFNKMNAVIEEATGKPSKVFRFPGGSNTDYNADIRDELLDTMASKGYIWQDWNSYDGDCDGISEEEMPTYTLRTALRQKYPVILMHDMESKPQTRKALPEIVNTLRQKGYSFGVLDESAHRAQFMIPS